MKFLRISLDDLRSRVPDVNDGIIATAGIVEGFVIAGAAFEAVVTAALAATIAGAAALGAAKYAEEAANRDAQLAVIEEERRQLELSPEQELRELVEHFESQGVEPHLAHQVAMQMTAHDALSAQLESEYGIRDLTPAGRLFAVAFQSAVAFVTGAALPVLIGILTPHEVRAIATLLAVLVALVITAVVAARLGHAPVGRTVLRSLFVGVIAMALAFGVGSLLPDPDGAAAIGLMTSSTLNL